jgi:repressor LexA
MTATTLAPLTDRQRAVYRYIAKRFRETRMGVTYRDVQTKFGFHSTNGAVTHMKALHRKGWIELHANQCRAILPTVEALAHDA